MVAPRLWNILPVKCLLNVDSAIAIKYYIHHSKSEICFVVVAVVFVFVVVLFKHICIKIDSLGSNTFPVSLLSIKISISYVKQYSSSF